MENATLKRTINGIDNLPILPAIYHKISQMTANPGTTAQDLARVIADDIALTSKLLKLVNSPFYGFARRITTIPQAIVIIGYSALRNLILTKFAFELFPRFVGSPNFEYFSFWKHSIGCGVGAKVISKYAKYPEPEEMFVSGLLHDIGKIVQEQYLREPFIKALNCAEHEGILILDAEKKTMGYTHTDTGNLIAEKWNLPEVITDSITYHHNPKYSDKYRQQVSIINLANSLSHILQFGTSGQTVITGVDDFGWKTLSIPLSNIESIMHEMLTEFKDAVDFIMSGF